MDNHATTPVDPRVLEEMLPYFCERFGNAASHSHAYGWEAEQAVDHARARIARLIGARPHEIVFTAGGTESDNLAIKGVAEMYREKGRHLVTCNIEHKAVLDCCQRLERQGFSVTYLPVRSDGRIDVDQLCAALTDETILVTIMAANNEIGVIEPLAEIGQVCRGRGVLFHTDAAQAVGKIPLPVEELHIDLLSIAGHKLYGPKGVGALYVRSHDPAVRLAAQMDGGGQERGLRSGTLNVPGIVGLGRACAIAFDEGAEESCRVAGLRNRLREQIMSSLEGVSVNGSMEHRLPGNLSLSFADVDGEALLLGLNDVAVSSSAACASAGRAPSPVLQALGKGDDRAPTAIRFGLGRFNTQAEVDYVARRVIETVRSLRELT
jgi:cysteine desulfurase